jgi:hypothetical protein
LKIKLPNTTEDENNTEMKQDHSEDEEQIDIDKVFIIDH